MLLISLPPAIQQSLLVPPPSLHGVEGSSFAGSAPPDGTVISESLVRIEPSYSGVVIWGQVDEVTSTWSAEHFMMIHLSWFHR